MVIEIKEENDQGKLKNFGNGHSSNSQKGKTQIENISTPSKKETIEELQRTFGFLRTKLNIYKKNPSIFAIIQDNPCLVKCNYDLRNSIKKDIDPIYLAKHDWIKKKIIDKIIDKFYNRIEVKSEYNLSNGKLDIIILQIRNNDALQLKYKTKTIAIEIKSGKTVDSKLFCQIERYLMDTDVLLMVRVPTQDVVAIHSDRIENELIEDVSLLIKKANRIASNSLKKVPGDWCKDCNVECEFKEKPKWNSTQSASLEDYDDTLKNTNMVIDKLMILLEEVLHIH
jgi:hypothetical protein